MKKLYVSDVDGTLYRGKSEGLSETGRELFIRLMQEGVGLTVASGRNLYGVYDLAASCGITLPVIAYNGAVIYDFGKGKAERTFSIQPADAQGLFERFDRQKIPYKTCVFRPQEERCVTYLQNGYRSPNWSERKKRIEQGCEDAVHPQNGLVYDEPFVDVPLSQLLEGECLYIGSSGEQQAITAIYEQAKQMLSENREVMDHLAEFLIKEETITGKEFMEIFHKYRLEQMERQVGMDVSDNTNE